MSRVRSSLLLVAALAATACRDATGLQDATITLVNQSALRVEYVFISQCTDPDWGPDRLEADEIIAAGASRQFTVEAGCWDMQAQLEDGRTVEDRGVELVDNERHQWIVQ